MNNNRMYVVRAFDTDYGFDASWKFQDRISANLWRDTLLSEYGAECQAYVYEEEV